MSLIISRNTSKHAPKDSANPAVHTSSPVVQKKNMFLSKPTQLFKRLFEKRDNCDASTIANAYKNCK